MILLRLDNHFFNGNVNAQDILSLYYGPRPSQIPLGTCKTPPLNCRASYDVINIYETNFTSFCDTAPSVLTQICNSHFLAKFISRSSCETHLPPQARSRMDIMIDNLELSPQLCAIDVFVLNPYMVRALPRSHDAPTGDILPIKAENRALSADFCALIRANFFNVGFETHRGIGKAA